MIVLDCIIMKNSSVKNRIYKNVMDYPIPIQFNYSFQIFTFILNKIDNPNLSKTKWYNFNDLQSIFYLPISSFSAFVPYKPDSLEKTKNSEQNKIISQTSTVTQEIEPPNEIPLIVNILKTSDTNFNSFQTKLQKKERKGSLKLKKGNEQNDYEYRPNKRISKKEPNSKLNENRNILPNTIHQLFSFGQRRNRSGPIVEKIFKKYAPEPVPNQIQYSIARFYIYQKHLKNKIGNYVTEDALRLVCNGQVSPQLFDPQEQRFYNKVFRILILSYLNEEANCSVLMSKRMYNDKKIQHIKTNRYLIQRMKSNFSVLN